MMSGCTCVFFHVFPFAAGLWRRWSPRGTIQGWHQVSWQLTSVGIAISWHQDESVDSDENYWSLEVEISWKRSLNIIESLIFTKIIWCFTYVLYIIMYITYWSYCKTHLHHHSYNNLMGIHTFHLGARGAATDSHPKCHRLVWDLVGHPPAHQQLQASGSRNWRLAPAFGPREVGQRTQKKQC